MELTLEDIREIIASYRPAERAPEHDGPYYAEQGRRGLADDLLAVFTDTGLRAWIANHPRG